MSRVFSVQFTPGLDNEFLSGGWDDTVQVIQDEDKTPRSTEPPFVPDPWTLYNVWTQPMDPPIPLLTILVPRAPHFFSLRRKRVALVTRKKSNFFIG